MNLFIILNDGFTSERISEINYEKKLLRVTERYDAEPANLIIHSVFRTGLK